MEILGKHIADDELAATVESCHPSIRRGSCAVFSVDRAGDRLAIVVVEIERRSGDDRRTRDVSPLDALESFWFEARDRHERRLGDSPAGRVEDDRVDAAVREAVRRRHDVEIDEVVLAAPGSLPRTPEGRVDRDACRARVLATLAGDVRA